MRSLIKKSEIFLKTKVESAMFVIEEMLGLGGSCIAYRVSYKENDEIIHYGILKEYCPAFLEESGQEIRDKDNHLIIPNEYDEKFNEGLEYFKNTYKTINNYLANNLSASNYHTVQLGFYEGNNTAYTLTSCDYGKSYEKVEDKSLHMLLKLMLSVTKAVEMYHNAGFLHLDIKPKNILILDDVADLVKLFDFDSLTSIDKIKSRKIDRIPSPEDYYVPELSSGNIRNIGVSTDIFEIGAMLYERLFGYAPKVDDIENESSYDFNSITLLNGVSPQAKYELEKLFKNTIQISPKARYKSVAELKKQLEKLISLTSDKLPFVMNLPKWQPSKYCIGREAELKNLKSRLDKDGIVFVKAMGGTGKSELVKLFAQKYENEYHTVQFCKYNGSLKSVVASIEVNGINDNDYSNIDELAKEKNKVLHNSDNHTLIIIDNYNVTYDEYLREFLPADNSGFKVIFTTRCQPANDYYSDKVFELLNLQKENALTLFYNHSSIEKNSKNDEIINEILLTIQYNTLVLVLLAQSIKNTNSNLDDVLSKLNNSKLEDIKGSVFHEYDFSSIDGQNYNQIFSHLNTIFNICNLKDIQKEILVDLSIVANIGIKIEDFISYCKCQYFTVDEIDNLYSLGWIQKEDNNFISLHPIVSDLMDANRNVEKKSSYENLADNIIKECYTFGYEHIDVLNTKFSYLFHLDKRFYDEVNYISIDAKLDLANVYYSLYMSKESKSKYIEAEKLISKSFRFKSRYCFVYFGLGEIENTFGSLDKAIEQYKKAIHYCKKSFNLFYEIRLDSMIGIGECYSKKHEYKKAYENYVKAYKFALKKGLYESLSYLCDDLINVCEELEMFDEANKYRDIKVSAEKDMHNNLDAAELSILNTLDASLKDIEKAKEYFYRGNLKEGLKQFYKYSEYLKETYGEESPEYKEFMSEMMPFIIMSNSDNGNISLTALDESVDFIKSKFGENSVRYAEFLILISEAISDSKEFDFSEKCAKKAKEICINLNLKNTFTYQESNLVLINSLIMQNRTNELQDVVSEIDFSVFKSKNDYEKLVKYAGMALVELNEYEKAIEISKALVEKKSVTPMIYCMACYILSQAFIEQGNADEALTYLKKEKPILDSLDNTILKEDYVSLYYCNYSCIYALKGDNNKAIDILNKYLIKIDTDDNFIKSNVVSRMYIYRTNYYRNMHDFNGGLESIKPVLKLIEIGDVFYKWHIEILYNASVCFTATGDIDKGIELFTQLENIFYFDEKDATLKMLDYLIFFIDALLVGGSYKVYNYIEKAENIVNENNLQKTLLNAQLLNYKGVYLSDYQNENGLANNSFNEAKELLEELNESNSPLYEQVLKNIEYVRDITVKSIIKDMAKSMLDN